jgi:hypothetical protein
LPRFVLGRLRERLAARLADATAAALRTPGVDHERQLLQTAYAVTVPPLTSASTIALAVQVVVELGYD